MLCNPMLCPNWDCRYPGQLGGDAIVNTLLGKNNPGGKSPITWYDDSILERSIYDMNPKGDVKINNTELASLLAQVNLFAHKM